MSMSDTARISKVPTALACGTLVAAIAAAAVVFCFGNRLASLPVLLLGMGTALVASAITLPPDPLEGKACEWWCGRMGAHDYAGPVGGKPWRLYVGVWCILAGTAIAALID